MAKVHAKEVVHDIRAGMSDTDRRQKDQVTPQGTPDTVPKLLDMKAITDAELSTELRPRTRPWPLRGTARLAGNHKCRRWQNAPTAGLSWPSYRSGRHERGRLRRGRQSRETLSRSRERRSREKPNRKGQGLNRSRERLNRGRQSRERLGM